MICCGSYEWYRNRKFCHFCCLLVRLAWSSGRDYSGRGQSRLSPYLHTFIFTVVNPFLDHNSFPIQLKRCCQCCPRPYVGSLEHNDRTTSSIIVYLSNEMPPPFSWQEKSLAGKKSQIPSSLNHSTARPRYRCQIAAYGQFWLTIPL
jgi:hypothetical protein